MVSLRHNARGKLFKIFEYFFGGYMTEEEKAKFWTFIKRNMVIVIYLLQIFFILMYSEPEVQPFVYVRF